MVDAPSTCPSSARLAAFKNGLLREDEMDAVVLHFMRCTDCRATARKSSISKTAIHVALAASVAVVSLYSWRQYVEHRPSIASLVRALRNEGSRPIQARLTGGFEWLPYGGTKIADGASPRLRNVAVSILQGSDRHATAIAEIVLRRGNQAVSQLSRDAETSHDPALWNDLAVARYQTAESDHNPALLGKALTAVDGALRLNPNLPEALFNRALILERFGLRDQARAAWEKYLAVDDGSGWSTEAREHVLALAPQVPFATRLDRDYERLTNDSAAARSLASQFPQQARTYGETKVLGRWAEAELGGDPEGAAAHLRLARAFGEQLLGGAGDKMLASAVAAIERADSVGRASIAHGHIDFRDGQSLYMHNKASAANALFERAIVELERGGSPVALLARYFAANSAYDGGRIAEARANLEHLMATVPDGFHAHRAQLQWQLGRYYLLDGRWGDALQTLSASVEGFRRLGESNYAATVREIVAEVYDRDGDAAAAWRERMIALGELGRQMTPRLQIAISSMTKVAMLDADWPQAASFLTLELDVARRVGTPVRRVEMALLRARVRQRMGNVAGARADLADARREIRALDDPAMSSLLDAEAVVVEAALASTPQEVIALLSTEVETHRARGRVIDLLEVLLQRGRAYAAIGDRTRASEDFEAGIAQVENGRESLPRDESRLGVFHASQELFEEAIELALVMGDAQKAFAYVERSRARQLLDSFAGASPAMLPRNVRSDTVVVEFAALPSRLLIFVVDRTGVRVHQQPIQRPALAADVRKLAEAMAGGDERTIHAAADALSRTLIEPIVPHIATKRRLVFVPDQTLAAVSFAALGAGGRNLLEDYVLSVSPSAAVFARLRESAPASTTRVLVVANPLVDSSDHEPLPAAKVEGERIAALYSHSTLLTGGEATPSAFAREAQSAHAIHFAGHAIAETSTGASLVLAGGRRMDAKAIASLHLEHTALVVLAGCSTAGGETRAAEGVLSLARAFIAAGVPSVIATLQPLDDAEAAEFFPRIHRHLAGGASPAEALQAVQNEWIHRPGARTATWASVELIGR